MIDRRTLVAVFALGCGAPGAAPLDVTDAGTDAGADAPPTLDARFTDCAHCHASDARDHAASMHARAFDDPLFQREWSTRRSEWCVGCHAPLAEGADDPRAHDGVGCESCHVEDGVILARTIGGHAPHPSRADARLGDPERCAVCHEFDFPRGHEQLQRTLTEWRASGRDETCIDCHMPEGSHRLLGPRDPDLLASALDIDVSARRERGRIVIHATLRIAGAAHAVPTGDLYRNLVLRASARAASAEAEMSRVFDRDEEGERIEIADQRVLPRVERRIELVLRASRGPVRWSLTWNALPAGAIVVEPIDETLRTREIARGTIALPR